MKWEKKKVKARKGDWKEKQTKSEWRVKKAGCGQQSIHDGRRTTLSHTETCVLNC